MSEGRHDPDVNDDSVDSSALGRALPGLGYQPVPPMSPPMQTSQLSPSETDSQPKGSVAVIEPLRRPWTPIALRRWYAISLTTFMLLVAVALEIALHFSNVKRGWRVPSAFSATTGILHYVYTLPPVAVAMVIVALWAWSDVEIKKIQPYIDLAYGNAPASKSMLLDYSNQHPAIVSVSAYHRSHYVVALSSLLVLVGLAIQPLAASLFTVKDTWANAPNINVTSFEVPGLNPDFANLTSFVTAAGFVQANVLYNVTPPNFVTGVWTIASVEVPRDQVANGTMFVNMTSVQSNGHCKGGDAGTITPFSNNTGFTIAGSSDGCSVSLPIQSNGTVQYGVDVVTCPQNAPPDPFKPVVFWTMSRPDPTVTPAFSLVFCTPTIQLLNVTAQVALQTGDLQTAAILGKYDQPNNITDPNGLMQGRAMNGVAFNLTGANSFAVQRAEATRVALAAAIIQKAQQSPGGLQNQIQSFGMTNITETIYDLYLSLCARNNYFVPAQGNTEVEIKTFQPHLWIVDVTVHILTAVLILFALICGYIYITHRRMRDLVILPHRPGTLASAAAYTARSNLAEVLDGHLDERALERVLQGKRFRIDKDTGRIVMEGDAGFETGRAIPVDRRRSVLLRLRDAMAHEK